MRYSVDEDFSYTQERIYLQVILKIFSIFIQFVFTVYLLANVWIIFVKIMNSLNNNKNGKNFIQNRPDWDLDSMENFEEVVTIIYFAVTSLSTVGFGDYYPITNEERIFISFILLFGVALFSYIMNQLTNVLTDTMKDFDQDANLSSLESFFLLLKYLNKSEPIDGRLIKEITEFIILRN